MDPPAPYDDYPYFGRYDGDHAHAPFVIVGTLVYLGLADWSATLLGWLRRYDGLEEHMGVGKDFNPDYRLDPVIGVRDVLLKHAAFWPGLGPGQRLTRDQQRFCIRAIVSDLLELPFIGTRAYWSSKSARVVWNPLAEDWLAFLRHGPTLPELRQMANDDDDEGMLQVWTEEAALIRKHDIRKLLLGEPAGDV